MPFTRRDYVPITKILKDEKVPARACQRLANYFSDTNPGFNYEKFMDACGHGIRKPKVIKRKPEVVEPSFLNGTQPVRNVPNRTK